MLREFWAVFISRSIALQSALISLWAGTCKEIRI